MIFFVEFREDDGDIELVKVRAKSREEATKIAGEHLGRGKWNRYHFLRNTYTAKSAKDFWSGFLRCAQKVNY